MMMSETIGRRIQLNFGRPDYEPGWLAGQLVLDNSSGAAGSERFNSGAQEKIFCLFPNDRANCCC